MYKIDIKVYETMESAEFPLRINQLEKTSLCDLGVGYPKNKSTIKTGYHTLYINLTETELTEFYDWAHEHGAEIKILGSQDLGHVDID